MEVPMPVLLTLAAPPAQAAVETPNPAAQPDTAAAAQISAVNTAVFHVEVVPTADSRNLRVRAGAPEEFGYVQFDSPSGDTPVLFDGKQVSLPAKLKLPTGKYEIRTVDAGKVVNSQNLEVKPLSTQTFKVVRP